MFNNFNPIWLQPSDDDEPHESIQSRAKKHAATTAQQMSKPSGPGKLMNVPKQTPVSNGNNETK